MRAKRQGGSKLWQTARTPATASFSRPRRSACPRRRRACSRLIDRVGEFGGNETLNRIPPDPSGRSAPPTMIAQRRPGRDEFLKIVSLACPRTMTGAGPENAIAGRGRRPSGRSGQDQSAERGFSSEVVSSFFGKFPLLASQRRRIPVGPFFRACTRRRRSFPALPPPDRNRPHHHPHVPGNGLRSISLCTKRSSSGMVQLQQANRLKQLRVMTRLLRLSAIAASDQTPMMLPTRGSSLAPMWHRQSSPVDETGPGMLCQGKCDDQGSIAIESLMRAGQNA